MFISDPSNPFVLVRLAMVKASVRAMVNGLLKTFCLLKYVVFLITKLNKNLKKDTVVSFVQGKTQNKIDKFVLNGESKRGWTTWLTTAVDKRVIGAIPMTMDLCNMVEVIIQ